MDVSLGCSLLSRQERLTPVFLHLLKDDSRWVREGGRGEGGREGGREGGGEKREGGREGGEEGGREGGVNAWLIDYEK